MYVVINSSCILASCELCSFSFTRRAESQGILLIVVSCSILSSSVFVCHIHPASYGHVSEYISSIFSWPHCNIVWEMFVGRKQFLFL